MVLITSFIDNNAGQGDVWGLDHVYIHHTQTAPNSSWAQGISFFPNNTTEPQLGTIVQQAVGIRPTQQGTADRFQRINDTGSTVGYDRTAQPTTVYTVITNSNGQLVTAYPGLPGPGQN